jgi:hypothetical protein
MFILTKIKAVWKGSFFFSRKINFQFFKGFSKTLSKINSIVQIAQMVASILFWVRLFLANPKKILQTSWKMVDRNAKTVASNKKKLTN